MRFLLTFRSGAYQSNFPIWSSYKALTELTRAPTRNRLASVLTNLIEYFMFFLLITHLTSSSRALGIHEKLESCAEHKVNDVLGLSK